MSPILHDYKPSAGPPPKKLDALHWFAVGLGIPLIGIALLLTVKNVSGTAGKAIGQDEVVVAIAEQDVALPVVELEAPPEVAVAAIPEPEQATTEPDDFQVPLVLPPEYERLTLRVRRGDTMNGLFKRNNLDLTDLAMILRLPEAAPHLTKLIPGDEFVIEHDGGNVVSVYRQFGLTSALKVSREDGDYFSAKVVDRPIEIKRRLAFGRIESSLFESATTAGLPDKLIMNLAGIFAWDVDFVLDIRQGDHYYILFEEIFQDGEYIVDGEIIAAEFVNNGRTFQAIRFVDKEGRTDYYTPEGLSVRKAFVRAPVDFTRISSSFNPRRRHPILNTIRAHRGVDYAAPRGTPVKAAGDGKVIFRGKNNGYGNHIILQHGGNITTLYAHMSRFNNVARVGRRVVQGQTIGYVGATGLATAPHLHYEYRLNGVHRNPRTVTLPQADPIKEEYRADFLATATPVLKELSQFKSTQVAYLTSD
ncbi:MAG: peptidoglycan DD-metalloendopeptidase family protein [Woeseiaceae bacterium]|nr:peptidoglycan DD-metalloendopeptidase family protein [Woeseiaceae bacterium]